MTKTQGDQLSQELLKLCKALAETGGRKALAGRLAGLSQVETKSTNTDMVTEFDRATEKYIVDEIPPSASNRLNYRRKKARLLSARVVSLGALTQLMEQRIFSTRYQVGASQSV